MLAKVKYSIDISIILAFMSKKKFKGEFYYVKIKLDPDPVFLEGWIRIRNPFFFESRIRIREGFHNNRIEPLIFKKDNCYFSLPSNLWAILPTYNL